VEFESNGWQQPRIVPYGPLAISPANSAIHYGQAIFEGLKAYRQADGSVAMFRPLDNWRRFNTSAERMGMPTVPEELFLHGLRELLKLDDAWVPAEAGTALYIRPFMFATDGFLGVRPSDTYHFGIITCPVGIYFTKPLRVRFEQHYVRAAVGGAGYAKNAGNYGAAMLPTRQAQQEGYHQLLWTDASEHRRPGDNVSKPSFRLPVCTEPAYGPRAGRGRSDLEAPRFLAYPIFYFIPSAKDYA
jgi:branched-chain amino acid aminotransferase